MLTSRAANPIQRARDAIGKKRLVVRGKVVRIGQKIVGPVAGHDAARPRQRRITDGQVIAHAAPDRTGDAVVGKDDLTMAGKERRKGMGPGQRHRVVEMLGKAQSQVVRCQTRRILRGLGNFCL